MDDANVALNSEVVEVEVAASIAAADAEAAAALNETAGTEDDDDTDGEEAVWPFGLESGWLAPSIIARCGHNSGKRHGSAGRRMMP